MVYRARLTLTIVAVLVLGAVISVILWHRSHTSLDSLHAVITLHTTPYHAAGLSNTTAASRPTPSSNRSVSSLPAWQIPRNTAFAPLLAAESQVSQYGTHWLSAQHIVPSSVSASWTVTNLQSFWQLHGVTLLHQFRDIPPMTSRDLYNGLIDAIWATRWALGNHPTMVWSVLGPPPPSTQPTSWGSAWALAQQHVVQQHMHVLRGTITLDTGNIHAFPFSFRPIILRSHNAIPPVKGQILVPVTVTRQIQVGHHAPYTQTVNGEIILEWVQPAQTQGQWTIASTLFPHYPLQIPPTFAAPQGGQSS